jgi:hypothetical protein
MTLMRHCLAYAVRLGRAVEDSPALLFLLAAIERAEGGTSA